MSIYTWSCLSRNKIIKIISMLFAVSLLIACGGGGGSGDDDEIDVGINCGTVTETTPNHVFGGRLEEGDCRMIDLSGDNDMSFVDEVRITLNTTGTLTITMRSSDVDAFLVLLNRSTSCSGGCSEAEAMIITFDDDSGGGVNGTDARISMDLAAGTYMILANSVDPQTGDYELSTTFSGMIWHLSDDFLLSPNQANPNPDSNGNNDVWWFQYNAGGLDRNPANFTLLPNFTVDPNSEVWDDGTVTPLIGLNKDADTMGVHPDFNQLVVTGWQSPVAGTVNIRGGFTHDGGGGNGVRWFVDHYDGLNVATLASGVLNVGGSEDFGLNLTADVQVGDFLYFSVDPNPANPSGPGVPGESDFDSTQMSLTINRP